VCHTADPAQVFQNLLDDIGILYGGDDPDGSATLFTVAHDHRYNLTIDIVCSYPVDGGLDFREEL